MVQFKLNNNEQQIKADPNMPLLWVIREQMQLTGTKFGCGIGQCGACTVHVNGVATKSCITPLRSVQGKSVTTIEGLGVNGELHPVQKAWILYQVPQCGYCQSGQIMTAASLLTQNPKPTDKDIDSAMSANICRCGTYTNMRAAIKSVSERINNE